LLFLTVGHMARFAVPDSGAQGKVSYSTHLPNLKSIASSIPEILKEFQIYGQTEVNRAEIRQTPLPTVKHYLPPPTAWRMASD